MEYIVALFGLTALVHICICQKNLKAHLEDEDRTEFQQNKGLPFLTRSNERRKFPIEKFLDEEHVFSAAVIKKNFDDTGEKSRLFHPTEIRVTVPEFTEVRTTTPRAKTKIPESLLIAMNDVETADEFLRRFVAQEPDDEFAFTSKGSERGSSVLGRKGLSGDLAPMAISEFAGCRPQKSVVKVIENTESGGVVLWPPCVYLNRCGGCCTSELMTCRPTAISPVNVTVLQARYTGPQSNPFANEGMRVITMEQHDRCTCQCKELPENCTALQEYRRNECRCVCANQNEAARCQQRQEKFWDSRDCTCKCRNPVECSSGLFFSTKTCRCEVLRFTFMRRSGSILPTGNETVQAHRQPQPTIYEEVKNIQHK